MAEYYPPCDYCGRERFIKEMKRYEDYDGQEVRICLSCWSESERMKERQAKMERWDAELQAALARLV